MGTTTASDLGKSRTLDSLYTSPDVIPITPNAGADLATPVRGLRCSSQCSLVVITFTGDERTVLFNSGETRYIGVTRVKSCTDGACVIEGLL